jgi:hypothetical protein
VFPTYEEKVTIIDAVIKRGGHGEEVLQAISDYNMRFIYKCTWSCPLTKRVGNVRPGFATSAELRKHRERDHTKHHLIMERTVTGNPRYCCDCGENHYLNDEELADWEAFVEVKCSDREAHLERVRNHGR